MNIGEKIINNENEWDYGTLSKAAKEAGGPSSLLNQIYNEGHNQGVIATLIGTTLLALAAIGGTIAYKTLRKKKVDNIVLENTSKLNLSKEMEQDEDSSVTEHE